MVPAVRGRFRVDGRAGLAGTSPEATSWDGAMNKAILISLAAVVVLIVIIALAALRFLRADDADPFDEAPDEPRRQPGRGHDDTRVRTAEPAIAGARRSAG